MKTSFKTVSYEYVEGLSATPRKKLQKPNPLFSFLIRMLAIPDLCATNFKYTKSRMEEAGKGPYLILMNHSSFIDLKIASKLLYPHPYFIVCTSDGFVGKPWLMRQLGCIPAQKFVADVTMTRDIFRAIRDLKTSVLLFPEASYSFDGTATPLPRYLGGLIKKLNVPVVTIITDGAFLRQPLYNDLKMRKVNVSAHMQCLFTQAEIEQKTEAELMEGLDEVFAFDNFRAQLEKKTEIKESFRAEGLNRILYRCPNCQTEGKTESKGSTLYCTHCGKRYEMDIYGQLKAEEGETEFPHIPNWYAWERECVKQEIISGTYRQELDVEIGILADFNAIYMVGEGKLVHDKNGFVLEGCDGKLTYKQSPLASYGLYSDFNWYEKGDVICIGDKKRLYYCFPKQKDVVAKARLAAEEMYKLLKK